MKALEEFYSQKLSNTDILEACLNCERKEPMIFKAFQEYKKTE
jgi:hypothetical protein